MRRYTRNTSQESYCQTTKNFMRLSLLPSLTLSISFSLTLSTLKLCHIPQIHIIDYSPLNMPHSSAHNVKVPLDEFTS